MKSILILLIACFISLACFSLYAEEDKLSEPSCRACIDNRIQRCLQQSLQLSSASKNVRASAETALYEAIYYYENKDSLARAMAERNIECKPYKVDYFLIKSFLDQSQEMAKAGF